MAGWEGDREFGGVVTGDWVVGQFEGGTTKPREGDGAVCPNRDFRLAVPGFLRRPGPLGTSRGAMGARSRPFCGKVTPRRARANIFAARVDRQWRVIARNGTAGA